ncbi:hypothetical protein AVEN_114783-1 [Araneus ventricosus]|uniref:Uncharacterized protein n=1 Tax=Araneus ventricosus TaxID=182803 RepID=A0A4Y2AGD0_ARAVE|nr:hypothetical protein AVEN_114783-1 [Araneus ventricosus]
MKTWQGGIGVNPSDWNSSFSWHLFRQADLAASLLDYSDACMGLWMWCTSRLDTSTWIFMSRVCQQFGAGARLSLCVQPLTNRYPAMRFASIRGRKQSYRQEVPPSHGEASIWAVLGGSH